MKTSAPKNTPDIEPSPARLRDGDRAAFNTLYRLYAPRVLGFLLKMTGDRGEAEDLMQETFLAGYSGCRHYAGYSRPLAWLLGIASRGWRDKQRKPIASTDPLLELTPDRQTGPEDRAIARTTLDQALDQLDPQYREVLLLIASQGLSYKEAAEATGEPLGTVKWRFHEATRRMRLALQAMEQGAIIASASHGNAAANQASGPRSETKNEVTYEPRERTRLAPQSGNR